MAKIGGKGLFTEELEKELLSGKIDLAVHSMKDVPSDLPPGFVLCAVTERIDPGDALISPRYKTLANLPPGAAVGTSSLRRRAQLLNRRPDINVVSIRGNIDTRLAKLQNGELDAIILAVAGLKRLGWESQITELLPWEICIPAMGQGALAIETRKNDEEVRKILGFLDHPDTATAIKAERAYLREIEGGCQVPVGVYGRIKGNKLSLDATILSIDGKVRLIDSIEGNPDDAENMGKSLAKKMYAEGGREILAGLSGVRNREGEE